MSEDFSRRGLPIRQAGSFGFDFAAAEWFHDSLTDGYSVRIAVPDLPTKQWDDLTEAVAHWWVAKGPLRPLHETRIANLLPSRFPASLPFFITIRFGIEIFCGLLCELLLSASSLAAAHNSVDEGKTEQGRATPHEGDRNYRSVLRRLSLRKELIRTKDKSHTRRNE